jgi:hypothetical protein
LREGQERAALVTSGGELRIEVVDLGLKRLPAAGQGTQRGLDGRGRVGERAGAQCGAGADPLLGGELAQRGADLLGRGQDQGVDLCSGLDAGLHRAPARCSWEPQPDANQRLNAA